MKRGEIKKYKERNIYLKHKCRKIDKEINSEKDHLYKEEINYEELDE